MDSEKSNGIALSSERKIYKYFDNTKKSFVLSSFTFVVIEVALYNSEKDFDLKPKAVVSRGFKSIRQALPYLTLLKREELADKIKNFQLTIKMTDAEFFALTAPKETGSFELLPRGT